MAAEWYFKNKPLLWPFMHPTKKSLNNIDFYLLTFLTYNKEIQFYPINKMCMLDTCALYAYSVHTCNLHIYKLWSLNSMQ